MCEVEKVSGKTVKTSSDKNVVHCDRVLPDPKVCRARIITGTLAECLVEQPWECPSAVSFGYSHMCMHPDRSHIIERTRAAPVRSGARK